MNKSFPLLWPEGWKTTPKDQRRNLNSRMSLYQAAKSLGQELDRLGATNAILSTNVSFSGSGAYSDRINGDHGAAVYFKWKGVDRAMACDRYCWVAQNVRGLALTLEAMRAIERHGASEILDRAFKGFTAISDQTSEAWREILDIPTEMKVTPDDIESQFRKLAHVFHPDKGGDAEMFHRLVIARENARKALGVER